MAFEAPQRTPTDTLGGALLSKDPKAEDMSSRVRRFSNPPGGKSTHNPFSWDDGSSDQGSNESSRRASGEDGGQDDVATTPSRVRQPAGGVSQIVLKDEPDPTALELKSRRPGSASKQKEMSGSGIFATGPPPLVSSNAYANGDVQNTGNYITDRPSVRLHQAPGGQSSVVLGEEEEFTLQTTPAPHRQAKQLELTGTLSSAEPDKPRPNSATKQKELLGNDIFGPPAPFKAPKQPLSPNPILGAPADDEGATAVAKAQATSQVSFGEGDDDEEGTLDLVAKKIHDAKLTELVGNNIFAPPDMGVPAFHELSAHKLKEMTGSDIFKDEKVVRRNSIGGIRQAPGGDSSIALV